jgi:DNA primase
MDNSLKEKVLESIDIVEMVGERVALTRKGKDYVGLCPFHPDHRPSLSVSPTKRIFKCWSCGAGGDVIRFVQLYERVEFREALASLARRAGIELRARPEDLRVARSREEVLAAVAWAKEHFRRNLDSPGGYRAMEYALGRGLTAETIRRFALGFAADARDDLLTAGRRAGLGNEALQHAGLVVTNEKGMTYDRFRNRLIFPIHDPLGRPIAFGGRALGDEPPKYLNSPETVVFSKSRVLYGLDLARAAVQKADAAIIVEGYMDAVMLSQFGFADVVATLGTALTEAHLKLLRPLAGNLYLCFDGDDAGVRAAERGVEVSLRTHMLVRVVVLDAGQDPADCVLSGGVAAFQARLNGAVEALEFKWSQALTTLDQRDLRARRKAVEEYVQFVARIALAGGVDPIQQDLLVGRLSQLLGVPPEEVFERLAREKRTLRRYARTDAAGSEGASAYEGAVRGLPGGLVAVAESVLGLLLDDATCWQWVDDTVAQAMQHSETWSRLYGLLLDVHRDVGEYSIRDVVSRCNDSALCELVSRARARVGGVGQAEEAFRAAHERLSSELAALRSSDLREVLRRSGGDDETAFQSLREHARGKESVLSPERRWSAKSVSSQDQPSGAGSA